MAKGSVWGRCTSRWQTRTSPTILRHQKAGSDFFARRLDPAGEVHRIANGREFLHGSDSYRSHHDLTHVNAHPNIELSSVHRLEVGVELVQSLEHAETGPDRAGRVVVVTMDAQDQL